MVTLNQVLLLQEKVESAVAKIAQLKAENDALRSKCAELTNALSAKTEQFSTFEADQNKIERGILQALERLNAVENAVLESSILEKAAVAGLEQSSAPAAESQLAQVQPVTETNGSQPLPSENEIPVATADEPAYSASDYASTEAAPVETEAFDEPAVSEKDFSAETLPPPQSQAAPDTEAADGQGQFDIF